MKLFVVDISFEDGTVIERVYSADSAFEAIDRALAEYASATGAGCVPEQHWTNAH